jgi:hypothetical protein
VREASAGNALLSREACADTCRHAENQRGARADYTVYVAIVPDSTPPPMPLTTGSTPAGRALTPPHEQHRAPRSSDPDPPWVYPVQRGQRHDGPDRQIDRAGAGPCRHRLPAVPMTKPTPVRGIEPSHLVACRRVAPRLRQIRGERLQLAVRPRPPHLLYPLVVLAQVQASFGVRRSQLLCHALAVTVRGPYPVTKGLAVHDVHRARRLLHGHLL